MSIFETIFPIFAISFIGYVVTYLGIFKAREISVISRFVFIIALPVLLFNALASIELPQNVNWRFLFSYYFVAVSIFLLAMFISGRQFSFSVKEQSVFGLGSAFSNTVLVGLPLVLAGLGQEALLPMTLIISVHGAVLFTLFTLVSERSGNGKSRWLMVAQTFKNLWHNPIIIGVLLGFLFNLFSVPIPQPVQGVIDMIGRVAVPTALFALGGSLRSCRVGGNLRQVATMVSMKLLIMPLLVWVMSFMIFRLEPLWGATAVMTAGMPVGVNVYIFSEQYGAEVDVVSSAILVSTIGAIFSQSLLLYIFA